MKLQIVQDLYFQEVGDLLAAEEKMLQMMPQLAKAARNEDLRFAFEEHAKETESQIARLKKIMKNFSNTGGVVGKGEVADALLEKIKTFQAADTEPDILEIALVLGSQKLEHNEIACYAGLQTMAKLLGANDDAAELGRSLSEEKKMSERLAALAEAVEREAVEAEQA
ncbi:MAG: ferritin-like domain-containing protein [Limisphaerales bacterium]